MNKLISSVPNDYLPLIGSIIVNFRLLETFLEMGIWKLMGAEKRQHIGKIITSEMSSFKLITLIGSLHKEMCDDEEAKNDFEDLLNEVNKVRENRNYIIHSMYGAGAGGTVLMLKSKVKNTKGLKESINFLNISDIENSADSIAEVSYKLQSFVFDSSFPSFEGDK